MPPPPACRPGRSASGPGARGSSDHAAVYGRYLIEPASGRPVSLTSSSLFTLDDADVSYRHYLAVAISQSGRTPEITTTLQRVRAAQGRAIAITKTRRAISPPRPRRSATSRMS